MFGVRLTLGSPFGKLGFQNKRNKFEKKQKEEEPEKKVKKLVEIFQGPELKQDLKNRSTNQAERWKEAVNKAENESRDKLEKIRSDRTGKEFRKEKERVFIDRSRSTWKDPLVVTSKGTGEIKTSHNNSLLNTNGKRTQTAVFGCSSQ